jgi:starch-binding outer membrane protein, SusD/RagB family
MLPNTFNKFLISTAIVCFAGISGCKKHLEVPLPIDQLATPAVFTSKATILAAADGMYNRMGQGLLQGNVSRFSYWISDEGLLEPVPGDAVGDLIRANIVEANSSLIPWSWFYPAIYSANEIMERLPAVSTDIMPANEKNALLGAARYVRAATHFTLTNLWGPIPLTLTTNAQTNIENQRTPVETVYQSIVEDLLAAVELLPATVNTTNSKTVHNKLQAQALLAKVYLYLGRWSEAEAAATAVISSGQYQLVTGVNNVFKRGSREAIFSWGASSIGLLFENRAVQGWLTLPATSGQATTQYCHIPTNMLANFETGDQRNISGNWTINLFNRTFSNKYLYNSAALAATIAANPQDYIYQRLAEIYLIRAEARAKQNNISGAAADINLVRQRAGLGATPASAQPEMLTAIEKERITELFYENHRWFDLKRTGRLNEVLGNLSWKKDNYKPYMELMPIPVSELIANPRIQQNTGY